MNIILDDVSMSYRPRNRAPREIFSHLGLNIAEGEKVGIIGPEGAGKSTLLQLMDGLHRPEDGHILVGGKDLWENEAAGRTVRQRIAYSFQFPEQQFFCETVEQELAFKLKNRGETDDEETREILRRVGLDPDSTLSRSPFSLSMGEARRVAIASVLVGAPELLLLDEPTAGLDGEGISALLSIVRQEFGEQTAVIVSHDMNVLSECVNRIVILESGMIVDDAPVADVFTDRPRVEALGFELPEGMQIVHELRRRGARLRPGFFRNSEVEQLLRTEASLRALLKG